MPVATMPRTARKRMTNMPAQGGFGEIHDDPADPQPEGPDGDPVCSQSWPTASA